MSGVAPRAKARLREAGFDTAALVQHPPNLVIALLARGRFSGILLPCMDRMFAGRVSVTSNTAIHPGFEPGESNMATAKKAAKKPAAKKAAKKPAAKVAAKKPAAKKAAPAKKAAAKKDS